MIEVEKETQVDLLPNLISRMTPNEMAHLCGEGSDGWLLTSHMVYILQQMTRSQHNTLCFCLNATNAGVKMPQLIKANPNIIHTVDQLVFVVNVGKLADGSVFIGSDIQSGNHWTLVVVNIRKREVSYGDNMAWGVPGGLLVRLQEFTSFFDVDLSRTPIRVCHAPTKIR